MNFTRKKVLLFLLLINTITTPMEERLLYNATSQGFYPALVNGTMSLDKVVPDSLVTADSFLKLLTGLSDLATFTYGGIFSMYMGILFRKGCLFGTELIPEDLDEFHCYLVKFLTPAIAIGLPNYFFNYDLSNLWRTDKPLSTFSTMHEIAYPLLVVSSTILLANHFHQKALVTLINNNERFSVKLKLKNPLDIAELDDAKCLICYDNESDKEYVNPCRQEDHIFCKECLVMRFNAQKNKSTFQKKVSFLCDACCKEVSFDDEKFELILPHVSLKLWAQQLGVDAASLCFYVMAMCTLGFLYHVMV